MMRKQIVGLAIIVVWTTAVVVLVVVTRNLGVIGLVGLVGVLVLPFRKRN